MITSVLKSIRVIVLLLALGGTAAILQPIRAARAGKSDPYDPSHVDEVALLHDFQPYLWFEPGRHTLPSREEWPCSYNEDNSNVEDNFGNVGTDPGGITVYASAEVLTDANGDPYWLLMYFYYYGANWNSVAWNLRWPNGYTHEHDWEWVYVFVSYDYHLDPDPDYVGYAAVLSAHNEDNLDAMGGECACPNELQDGPCKGRAYLFPRVMNSIDGTGVTFARRLEGWAESNDPLDLRHVRATVTRKGNPFEPNWPVNRSGGVTCKGCASLIYVNGSPPSYNTGTTCTEVPSGHMAFGDPELAGLTWDCLGLNKYLGDLDECGDVRPIPWQRNEMIGADGVPSGFDIPAGIYWVRVRSLNLQEMMRLVIVR